MTKRRPPRNYIVIPATDTEPEQVECVCDCQRQHETTRKVRGRFVRLPSVHVNPEGPCGRVFRKIRPKRGPAGHVCPECLSAYSDNWDDLRHGWVDPSEAAKESVVYDTETAEGLQSGTVDYVQQLREAALDKPESNVSRGWADLEADNAPVDPQHPYEQPPQPPIEDEYSRHRAAVVLRDSKTQALGPRRSGIRVVGIGLVTPHERKLLKRIRRHRVVSEEEKGLSADEKALKRPHRKKDESEEREDSDSIAWEAVGL